MTSLKPVSYENLRWEPRERAGVARSRYGTYHPVRPAVITDLAVDLPPAVVAQADLASNEITRFDAELGAEIAPFSAVLLRSESPMLTAT